MAQGSIIWRCRTCGNKAAGTCQHPKAAYAIVYRVGKRQKWKTVGRAKKDAQRRLTRILSQLHDGTFRETQPVLFSVLAHQWLRDYAQGAVKPLTYRFYRTLLTVHLIPAFGEQVLTQIAPQDVQGFLARCLRDKHLSPKTTNSLLTLLKGVLTRAEDWGYLRENPAKRVKPVRSDPKEMGFLRPDELRRLIQHADEPFRTLFLAAALTGMRRGELLGLQWGDIDWHNSIIHVQRSLYHTLKWELDGNADKHDGWRFSTPKSQRSIRTVAMSPKLRVALELHRLQCPRSQHDLVFCTKDGQPMHAENMIRREFLPALSRAELRRIRFHDLRHTYTTLLIAQGENPKLIQAQLGHASIETTLDRYGHLLPDSHQHLGDRLDAQVFGQGNDPRANTVLTKYAETASISPNHEQQPFQPVSA